MLNNFIYAQTKDLFLDALNAGNVLDEAIVFIEDTKEIWNHGHYFAGESIDPKAFAEMQTNVANIQVDKLDKSEAESTYATKEELEEIKWLVLKPDLITFTVDGTEYQAEEGMTWNEFVDSEYNDGNWRTMNDDQVIYTGIRVNLNGIQVKPSDSIVEMAGYTISGYGGQ